MYVKCTAKERGEDFRDGLSSPGFLFCCFLFAFFNFPPRSLGAASEFQSKKSRWFESRVGPQAGTAYFLQKYPVPLFQAEMQPVIYKEQVSTGYIINNHDQSKCCFLCNLNSFKTETRETAKPNKRIKTNKRTNTGMSTSCMSATNSIFFSSFL